MFPHEGEVIALEGRLLSQYSVRVCLFVNSMQDPHHRKRQRQQAREQAHEEDVQEVPGSGTQEEREEEEESEEDEEEEECTFLRALAWLLGHLVRALSRIYSYSNDTLFVFK